jgi:ankyrin repeat protein
VIGGANVHEKHDDGRNAHMLAIMKNCTPVVHKSIRFDGARISDTDERGITALAFAVHGGRYSIAQWLLENGGALITDDVMFHGMSQSLWDSLYVAAASVNSVLLLKRMVLLGDAPLHPTSSMSCHNSMPKL